VEVRLARTDPKVLDPFLRGPAPYARLYRTCITHRLSVSLGGLLWRSSRATQNLPAMVGLFTTDQLRRTMLLTASRLPKEWKL
jgi:hypothetical protein